ncbi:MAG TPA: methylmalonyl Co-A mutase-associated GTPase MeaB, partial [Candidatus Cloacimonadota bacterium]|nr:methylmalonyl Co-A mutase-associated GTPase MeaB [Candidatus Cloacimonadota bacterium]
VDPSSSISKGSILGDKTRMERLARDPLCFIRPSPSGGTLGGVTKKTRETMLLCEAAGYDVILVETVGVGQSEITVRSMVDFFLLLQIPGAGDELQGIKKGVIELADAIVVNKADGDNIQKAELAKTEYAHALHYIAPATEGWKTDAYTCSAYTGDGIEEMWKLIEEFKAITVKNGFFQKRRNSQVLDWVKSMIQEHLESSFYQNPQIKATMPGVQKQLLAGEITASMAVEVLLKQYTEGNRK